MKPLHDSAQLSFAPRSELQPIKGTNFKTLEVGDSLAHLSGLNSMLKHMKGLVKYEVLTNFHANDELSLFVEMIQRRIKGFVLRIERERFINKESLKLSIDPTNSGFPLFVRDFQFQNNARQEALQNRDQLPSNQQLVEDALFTVFRGVYPADIIEAKMTKDIYDCLADIPEAIDITVMPPVIIDKTSDASLYRLVIERFEENHNLPRFYVIHFRVPTMSSWGPELSNHFVQAVRSVTNTTVNRELTTLARALEDINGICISQIQRVDLGPFYNQFTHNSGAVEQLLGLGIEDDSIIMFNVTSIHRVSETKVTGVGNWFNALTSGDWMIGIFSKPLTSPTYIILPHRLIQKAHHYDIKLDRHVRMFGLDAKGGLFESSE